MRGEISGEGEEPGQPCEGEGRHGGQDVLGGRDAPQQVTEAWQDLSGNWQVLNQFSPGALCWSLWLLVLSAGLLGFAGALC